MKKVIALLLLLNLPLLAREVSKVGTTAASFLNIDVGSRAVAMGGAFTAVASDASASYWNPAGIARLQKAEALYCNNRWIADLNYNYISLVIPVGSIGSIGINAASLSMDEMKRTTISQPDGTGETFDAGSYAFGLCFARNLTDRFSIGINAKYIYEVIYHCSAKGMAIDVGTLFDTKFNGLKVGMSISNYGTKMQMTGRDMLAQVDVDPLISGNNSNINANLQTDAYDLPLMLRIGLSMDVLKGAANSNLLLSVDALHPNDDVEYINIGGEYIYNQMFVLCAGYRSLFAQDAEGGLSLGGGLQYSLTEETTVSIDYAYLDFGLLNYIQMFTFSFKF